MGTPTPLRDVHLDSPTENHFEPLEPGSIPIPGRNASTASTIKPVGPSSEGAIRRESSVAEQPLASPSSAPPTPSVIASTHPSLYIHTQHPRRGSMTPLGLHVISPMPPLSPHHGNPPVSPVRSVGFTTNAFAGPSTSSSHLHHPVDPLDFSGRRGSAASTCSTLTQTRPVYPPGFNPRDRRRSSITPGHASLVPPSPSRTHVSGRLTRPNSSDGSTPGQLHRRERTTDGAPLKTSPNPSLTGDEGRRGSLPHLGYGGWTGPSARWNPSLPPQRGSVEEVAVPDEGYKFGSGPLPLATSSSTSSSAAQALRSIDLSPSSRRSSWLSTGTNKKREDMDAFEQAEYEEAERQRRAFLKATYGEDGRRARERLSFAAPSIHSTGGSPKHSTHPSLGPQPVAPPMANGGLRRQSLMLWERLSMATPNSGMSKSSDVAMAASRSEDMVAQRRGSVPMAIPGNGLGRSPSTKKKSDMDIVQGDEDDDEDDEDDDDMPEEQTYNDNAPKRPLPPLMPLSDPGPRLLPSTLALHRANHLLTSRNLQAEPLPHPLPPSLHPPAPVDLAEFDIDFILAGSQSQMGGESTSKNTTIDVRAMPKKRTSNKPDVPVFKLGGAAEEEDSFAKFVGQFDDEYGDRRGEWTFRVCPPSPRPSEASVNIKAEWDSPGAGRYEIMTDGRVVSEASKSVWKVTKSSSREYLLTMQKRGLEGGPHSSTTVTLILACKSAHADAGGIKSAEDASSNIEPPPSDRFERSVRLGSADSAATARGPFASLSQSLPLVGMVKTKDRALSHGSADESVPPPNLKPRASISGASGRTVKNTEPDEKKREKGLGGVLKRAFKGTIAAHEEKKAAREERERDKAQSQSWSPSVSRSKDFIHPSGKSIRTEPQSRTAPPGLVERKSTQSTGSSHSSRAPSSEISRDERPGGSGRGSRGSLFNSPFHAPAVPTVSEGISTQSSPQITQSSLEMITGKAWDRVPEESVAMIIPCSQDQYSNDSPLSIFPAIESRQAMLVWYVPFNSDTEDRPTTAASTASKVSESAKSGSTSASTSALEPSTSQSTTTSTTSTSSQMPKFQKLLRRRTSKDSGMRREKEREREREREREAASQKEKNDSNQTTPTPGVFVSSFPDDARISKISCALAPLPFRSFRIVARLVDVDDLRSERDDVSNRGSVFFLGSATKSTKSTASTTSSTAPSPASKGNQQALPHVSSSSIPPVPPIPAILPSGPASSSRFTPGVVASPTATRPGATGYTAGSIGLTTGSGSGDSSHDSSATHDRASTAYTSFSSAGSHSKPSSGGTIPTLSSHVIADGRSFPTVIGVCHSRTQGVEFVLEGLDRLGFCKGESAWGPTGYEEWRGSGLSENGKELLDCLWAGCTGVMGLHGV